MNWKILDTGIRQAEENMRLDADLLSSLENEPILHFYDWDKPSLTYGYFVKPENYLNLEALNSSGVEYARRPTGGGIVFHLWDLAFSLLVPASTPYYSQSTLDNYRFVNEAVQEAAENFLKSRAPLELIKEDAPSLDFSSTRFCMARPTKYDLVLNGKKIAGAAQRQTKTGFLHQGTIALTMPRFDLLEKWLLPGTRVLEAIKAHTFPLMGSSGNLEEARLQMRKHLVDSFDRRALLVGK